MALGDKLPISFSLYSFSFKIIVLRQKQLPDGVNLRVAHFSQALLWKQKLKLNTAAFHSHLWEHLDRTGFSRTPVLVIHLEISYSERIGPPMLAEENQPCKAFLVIKYFRTELETSVNFGVTFPGGFVGNFMELWIWSQGSVTVKWL